MESALGLQHVEISFREKWQEKPPEDAGHLLLNDYMIRASSKINALLILFDR